MLSLAADAGKPNIPELIFSGTPDALQLIRPDTVMNKQATAARDLHSAYRLLNP
jgi:hypothetical protein